MKQTQVSTFGFGSADNGQAVLDAIQRCPSAKFVGDGRTVTQLVRSAHNGTMDAVVVNLDIDGALDSVRQLSDRSDCLIIGVGRFSGTDDALGASQAGCAVLAKADADDFGREMRAALGKTRARCQDGAVSSLLCVVGTGGSGATTVACMLSVEVARILGSAGVVDLDLEYGSVGTAFDCNGEHSIIDICADPSLMKDHDTFRRVLSDPVGGVHILARPPHMEQAEEVDPERLEQVLDAMREVFPFVVVDLSRPNGSIGLTAMRQADRILVVTQPNVPSMLNAKRALEMAERNDVEPGKLSLVLNRHDTGTLSTADVARIFGRGPLAMLPNDWESVHDAMDSGKQDGQNGVRSIVAELAARITGTTAEAPKKSFLRRTVSSVSMGLVS